MLIIGGTLKRIVRCKNSKIIDFLIQALEKGFDLNITIP